jgi:PhoH-like ATPase
MAKKRYILDTSVLLHDPEALFKFKDNEVHIPEVVLQELDKKKNSPGIIGKNSRQVTRHLDKLSLEYFEALPNIPLPNSGCLVLGAGAKLSHPDTYGDIKIIEYSQQCPGAIVVSKDLGLRVAARTQGIYAEDYRNERVESIYTGHRSVCCESDDELVELWSDPNKSILVDSLGDLTLKQLNNLTHNECVTLMASGGRQALTRYDESRNRLSVISTHNGLKVTGIQPLNSEQKYALELLLDPKVTMMSLVGQAGSGKTLLALAAALHMCQNLGLYETIIIGRKEVGVGDKPPWLPGNIQEKTDPWLAGLYGCLNQLAKTDKTQKGRMVGLNPYDIYVKSDNNPDGPVETVSLSYIRGVTWRNSIIVLDEMQNVPPAEAKTIATRIGSGSKLILLGDVEQIDQEAAKFMDEFSNGLAVTTERMRGYQGFAHLTLLDSVRSELARAVAQRMK